MYVVLSIKYTWFYFCLMLVFIQNFQIGWSHMRYSYVNSPLFYRDPIKYMQISSINKIYRKELFEILQNVYTLVSTGFSFSCFM